MDIVYQILNDPSWLVAGIALAMITRLAKYFYDHQELIEMKEALEFTAMARSVKCPECGYENLDLLGDPRGKETTCDDCGEEFTISNNAEINVDP